MPVKVIDASALAAVLFNEPDAEKVIELIGRASLLAPALISFELASVCLKKIRAHPRQRNLYVAAFQLLPQLDIEVAPVDLAAVNALAEGAGITVYDACYLWLAREQNCDLLTLDRTLAAASRK